MLARTISVFVLSLLLILIIFFTSNSLKAVEFFLKDNKVDVEITTFGVASGSEKQFDYIYKQVLASGILKELETFLEYIYCQKKEDTYLIFHNNRSCYSMELKGNKLYPKKGKKISKEKFFSLNPFYTDKINLVCIQKNMGYTHSYYASQESISIYFLTHTLNNEVYLRYERWMAPKNQIEYEYNDFDYKLANEIYFHNHIFEYNPKGISTYRKSGSYKEPKGSKFFRDEGYLFKFFKYSGEKLDIPSYQMPSGETQFNIITTNGYKKGRVHNFGSGAGYFEPEQKCYSNKEYMLAMFKEAKTTIEEVEVVQNTTKKEEVKVTKQETKTTTPKMKTEQVVVTKSNLDKKSLKEELKYWKELFEDELITQKEYDAKRKALLEGGVTVTQTKKTTKPKNEIVKKAKVDKSYKNKDYLYPKIGKRFNAWRTSKIINRCMSDYKKILESIECTKDNIRATNRYKKGRLYMDLYNLHLNSIEGVETAMLNGQITESQAKNYILQLNSQTISSIELRDAQDDAKRAANKQRGDALMKLGQEMMKPGFDWTTGTSSSTNQNNNNSFQNSNRKPCMYNFATNEYQQCVHLGADQVCYHFTLPCTP